MASNNKNCLGMYFVIPFGLNSIHNWFDLPIYTIIPKFNIYQLASVILDTKTSPICLILRGLNMLITYFFIMKFLQFKQVLFNR